MSEHDNPRYVKPKPNRDLLAEVLSNDQLDWLWVPLYRATTKRGLLRVVARYLRDTGVPSYDLREYFETPPRIDRVWVRATVKDVEDPWCERPWHRYDDEGRPFTKDDEGTVEMWQVMW